MLGLMQDWPLTVDRFLEHAAQWHAKREVVTRSVEGPIMRTTYAELFGRAKRVSNALLAMGVKPGDRVATLAWNSGRHMEAWYGIMGIGAVCHTLNPRLFPEQLCYIINHAQDRIIFTDLTFLPVLMEHRDKMPSVEKFIVLTDRDHMGQCQLPGALCFETLVETHSADVVWGDFGEQTACGLCYTSGTTGNPKGVLYSHRSNFLHTLVTAQHDVMGLSVTDVVLPVVPMFHANAWGLAFSCPAIGSKMVMPGMKMDGESILELLETEGVTFSAAVPTVWQMLLQHMKATNAKLTTLKRVVIGGSAVPEALIRAFHDDYGVEVTHAWGMTETSPLGTLSTPTPEIAALPYDQQMPYKLKQGRPPAGVQLKLTDDDGKELPHDGTTFGRLKISGPFIVGQYFKGEGGEILDEEGFFDTGDVATIDDQGYMQITDRAKDVIKSGGEWISSIEIENIAAGHPKALLAAVIGVAHPKWDERPLLLVKLKDGESATKDEFLRFLEGKIAKWWTPDDVVFVDDIPLGATGKIDKKLIRSRMGDYGPADSQGRGRLKTLILAAAVALAACGPASPSGNGQAASASSDAAVRAEDAAAAAWQADNWEKPMPPNCGPVDAVFVIPAPEARRQAALDLMRQAQAVQLDEAVAASFARVPYDAAGGSLAGQRLGAEIARLGALKATPAWTTWNADRLAALQAIARTGAPAGLHPYLVRGIAKNVYGSFSVRLCGRRLEVLHSSMGHDTPPSRRAPVIVFLAAPPEQVDVRWSMAG